MRIRRALSVIAHVDGLREIHSELARPVRAAQLRAVFDREGIEVTRAKIRRRAFVDGAEGVFVVTLRNDLAARVQTKVLLHEYAHIHLHLTDSDGEVTRQLLACQRGDVREHEADLFAALLWYGPDATPSHPAIAPIYAKLEAPAFVRAAPTQIPLPLPEPLPRYHGKKVIRVGKVQRPKKPWWFGPSPVTGLRGVSHNALRFDWKDDGKPLGFFHLDLGWIKVYDRMRVEADGQRTAVLVKCGDKRTRWREFVVSSTVRRVYTFRDGERRGRSVEELDRQILAARRRWNVGDVGGQKVSATPNVVREDVK